MAGPVLAPRRIAAVAATVPVVVVARHSRSPSHDSITNDDRMGARIAVDHLVSLGHRRIAHVDGARAPARRSAAPASRRWNAMVVANVGPGGPRSVHGGGRGTA